MRIEVLFPERCNLYGDLSNVEYLKRCLPQAEFVETSLQEEPRFAKEPVDLVYLGPMTERTQELVLERLRPHRERLEELIQQGTPFLFTGNALELLGESIQKEGGESIPCLGLFPFTARRDMMHRHNSIFLGEFEGRPVMGFKSQFTMAYPKGEVQGLFTVTKGVGLNKKCHFEGVRRNHFFGTYLLGPLLVNNPPFTRSLLKAMGAGDVPLALEQAVEAAYEKRLEDFREKA